MTNTRTKVCSVEGCTKRANGRWCGMHYQRWRRRGDVAADVPQTRVGNVALPSSPDRPPHHQTCHHRLYQLSCDEFDAIWERAEGRCERCHIKAEDTRLGKLTIDHDHHAGIGAVRGLLCSSCNTQIGRYEMGEEIEGAAEYCANAWWLEVGRPADRWA